MTQPIKRHEKYAIFIDRLPNQMNWCDSILIVSIINDVYLDEVIIKYTLKHCLPAFDAVSALIRIVICRWPRTSYTRTRAKRSIWFPESLAARAHSSSNSNKSFPVELHSWYCTIYVVTVVFPIYGALSTWNNRSNAVQSTGIFYRMTSERVWLHLFCWYLCHAHDHDMTFTKSIYSQFPHTMKDLERKWPLWNV